MKKQNDEHTNEKNEEKLKKNNLFFCIKFNVTVNNDKNSRKLTLKYL